MLAQIRGLVLDERLWGEHDKLITLLTADRGKTVAVVKGGSSLKNKIGGACMPFAYSELTLADRGGTPWVREANEIRGFHGIRSDLEKTATALYVLDVVKEVCVEDGEESEMLQLALNTLHAIETDLKPVTLIKAAFELRTAAACGFSPDLVACSECGEDNGGLMYLDVMDGVITCRKCRERHRGEAPAEGHTTLVMILDRPLLDAMRLVAYSPAKKFLSFELPEEDSRLFCSYCEKFLLNHIDRGFSSLEFLKSLRELPPLPDTAGVEQGDKVEGDGDAQEE